MVTIRHGSRTTGNIFKKVPSVIYELSKLTGLNLSSVQLEEFPEEKIYEALPELEHVNVSLNNLRRVPIDGWNTGGVVVETYDNPGSPYVPIHHKIADFCYNMWSGNHHWESILRNFA